MSSRLPRAVRLLNDRAWLSLLVRSVRERHIAGIDFPGFPSEELQAAFVGSANEKTLKEAFAFYVLVKKYSRSLGHPLRENSRFLDFGCGWGRFLRFFWKDIAEDNLYGCDVNAEIVESCHQLGVPGTVDLIDPRGELPYPDGFFDGVMAYSVFTHLPEETHLHWMRELARVTRAGATFCLTLEPRRFIDFIGTIPPDTDVDWYHRLSMFKPHIDDFRLHFDSGNIVFMGTNQGLEDTYGDAVVPLSYIDEKWAPRFRRVAYIDDPDRFWQAVLVVQRL